MFGGQNYTLDHMGSLYVECLRNVVNTLNFDARD